MPGHVLDDVDAVLLQQGLVAHAGELEDLRRADRAGTEDHFAGGGGAVPPPGR